MKTAIAAFCILAVIGWAPSTMAADEMSHDSNMPMAEHGKGEMAGMPDEEHKGMEKHGKEDMTGMTHGDHEKMGDHGKGKMEGMAPGETFKHQAVVEGLRADFEIMSLSSMNMKDPEGNTHHIMVTLQDESTEQKIEDAFGSVKVIGPDEQAQTNPLKNYGGIQAANVTFDKHGKYGVICLVKIDGKKHIYKFWYPHEM